MLIYKVTNLINNKSYIGQTITSLKQRKAGHISDVYNPRKTKNPMVISKAIKKYGEGNFKWEIICEAETQDELNKLESFHILENNSLTPNGYNRILFNNTVYKKSNGRRLDITEFDLYVAISKSNSIREVSDYLDISHSSTNKYLKKYNYYKYMFEKSRRNCKYSHKHEYDKNILS